MNINEKDYYKIIDYLHLNQLDIDKSFFPKVIGNGQSNPCLLYTSPSPRDATLSRMPSSA